MKAQTGVNRHQLSLTRTSLVLRPFSPLVESSGSVYLVGVGLGVGCGGLVVMLLLGMLSLPTVT
jgi:hypothetical protein